MERVRMLRAAGGAAALAMVLGACGGGQPVASGDQVPAAPAAVIVSARDAASLVPTPSAVPTPAATATSVIAPTGFARPERTQGPPGNPVAQNFSDPPTAGRYPFRVIVQGGFGQQESEFEVEFSSPVSTSAGKRQEEFWDIQGFPQQFTYLWGADSLRLEKLKSQQPDGSTVECEFKPPALVMKLPMSVGSKWNSTSQCDGQKSESRSEVIRTEVVEVGGQPVDTFVIKTVGERGDETETTTSWYAPSVRLVVLFESESTTEQFGEFKMTVEALGLAPSAG